MMSWRVDRKTRQIALTCTCYIGAQNPPCQNDLLHLPLKV